MCLEHWDAWACAAGHCGSAQCAFLRVLPQARAAQTASSGSPEVPLCAELGFLNKERRALAAQLQALLAERGVWSLPELEHGLRQLSMPEPAGSPEAGPSSAAAAPGPYTGLSCHWSPALCSEADVVAAGSGTLRLPGLAGQPTGQARLAESLQYVLARMAYTFRSGAPAA